MADEQKLLADLASENADVRFAAWRQAGELSPAAVEQLGKLAGSEIPGVARAGREALTTLVHSVGKDPSDPKRPGVVNGLLTLIASSQALPVRVHAFRLLSNIAADDAVPALVKHLSDAEVREEAIYAIERIPGAGADKALIAAYSAAPDAFKPRVLAALGHRRVADAADLCVKAMQSENRELSVAATKAYGRIGKKSQTPPRLPGFDKLSPSEQFDSVDAMLRFAEAQIRDGDPAEAMRIYKMTLARPEEHWQCAAVIGLAKLGTPEAAVAMLPKLKSENRKVRITAENAWKSMAASKG